MGGRALLAEVQTLLNRPDPATAGIWPRATALLARQALETALSELWQRRAPGLEQCPVRAQLLCLPGYLPGHGDLVGRVSYAWASLSRACHHHTYDLAPTADEIASCIETVGRLVEAVEQVVRRGRGI